MQRTSGLGCTSAVSDPPKGFSPLASAPSPPPRRPRPPRPAGPSRPTVPRSTCPAPPAPTLPRSPPRPRDPATRTYLARPGNKALSAQWGCRTTVRCSYFPPLASAPLAPPCPTPCLPALSPRLATARCSRPRLASLLSPLSTGARRLPAHHSPLMRTAFRLTTHH